MTAGIQAASIGIPDTFFILMLALVVFGPKRLPEIGRQIGKLMFEFRKASNEFKYQMEEELRKSEEAERKQKLLEENRKLYPALGQAGESAATAGTVEAVGVSAGEVEGAASAPATGELAAVNGGPTSEAVRELKIMPPATGETVATSGKTAAEIARESAEEDERLNRAGRLSEMLAKESSAELVNPPAAAEAVEIVSSKRAPRSRKAVKHG